MQIQIKQIKIKTCSLMLIIQSNNNKIHLQKKKKSNFIVVIILLAVVVPFLYNIKIYQLCITIMKKPLMNNNNFNLLKSKVLKSNHIIRKENQVKIFNFF